MKTATNTTATFGDKSVVIWLHTTEDPLPEEWAVGIEATKAAKNKNGFEKLRSLVVSDGGAPNVAQRKELNEQIFEGRPSQLAVITSSLDNPLKRGVATAIGWVNPKFKAVLPDRWKEAIAHLDLSGHTGEIIAVLQELQKDLPVVKTLATLERLATADGVVIGRR